MYQSLKRHTGVPFTLWILCFDKVTYDILNSLRLPGIRLITERDFEQDDEALVCAKASRTRVEYYWTCTPSLPLYIFRKDPTINVLSYLDADTFFFSSPVAIADELGERSILIVPHDYSKEFEGHADSGIYNVGIMAFRNDNDGVACLSWWRERCIEWCYWRHENGLIGDQAYLNDWPQRFENVAVSSNPGINAAPWNIAKYGINCKGDGRVFVNERVLVCYHFHSLKICTSRLIYLTGFNVSLPTALLSMIYRPYIDNLMKTEQYLFDNKHKFKISKAGVPWRYIAGRVIRRQPIEHFMWLGQSGFK